MANYTFKVNTVCEGGCHYSVQVLKDGIEEELIMLNMDSVLTWSDGFSFILKQIITNAGTKTKDDNINAIESAVITL